MNERLPYDALFSDAIGKDYETLKLICPLATEMSRWVGHYVGQYSAASKGEKLKVVELGGGTGITTLSILTSRADLEIISVDNEPIMQNQAKENLKQWVADRKLDFCGNDALSALRGMEENSIDVVASAYTIHNFDQTYRDKVIKEIYRVLKPSGQFINGDRYALDDIKAHTRSVQEEIGGYFKVLIGENKLDVLEQWIVHLFNDESQNHVMRETAALEQLAVAGFISIELKHRMAVNALVTACKPD
ncbi:MAG: class I SAM-dependent methyltransferase [Methylomicrobium sp.]|nr:class I SAM-dependent methyltransferase [Methylomicrobium sp.]